MSLPCCQAWFYLSSSRQWDSMTSWHRLVARHGSMCHHPYNETEWPHGTALLPGMVLCVIIQTMRLNDLMAPPCCQARSSGVRNLSVCMSEWVCPHPVNFIVIYNTINLNTYIMNRTSIFYFWHFHATELINCSWPTENWDLAQFSESLERFLYWTNQYNQTSSENGLSLVTKKDF